MEGRSQRRSSSNMYVSTQLLALATCTANTNYSSHCVHTSTNFGHQGCTGCPNRQLCTIPVAICQHKVIPSVHLIMHNGGIKCVEVGTFHPPSTHRDCVGRGRGVGCTQNTIVTFATFCHYTT